MQSVAASTEETVDEGTLVRRSSYLPGPYMTVKDAAEWTGLHPESIRKMARAGTLDAVKFGSGRNAHWRIPLSRLVPSEPYHHLLMVNMGRRRLTDRLAELARKTNPTTGRDIGEAAKLFHEWYQLTVAERAPENARASS